MIRTMDELLADFRLRLKSVERRLATIATGGGGGEGITYVEGPGIDISGNVISAEAPPLPPVQRFDRTADTFSVTATAVWGDVIPGTPVVVSVDRPLWVLVTFGAWMVASAGETRAGVRLSGATVCDPQNAQSEWGPADTTWGQTLYMVSSDGTASAQRTMQRLFRLNAGSTTFTPVAYMTTAGTKQVNYPTMEVTPIAWVDVPVPVRTTQGALTRRHCEVATAVTTAFQTVDWNLPVADSGHFTFNATTDAFTCVVPGTYRVSAGLGFSSCAGASYGRVRIRVNGASVTDSILPRHATQSTSQNTDRTVSLLAGDTVDVVFEGGAAEGTLAGTTGEDRGFIELVPVTVDSATQQSPARGAASRGSNQSVASGSTYVKMTGLTAEETLGVGFADDALVVQQAGVYLLEARIVWAANSTGNRTCALFINSAQGHGILVSNTAGNSTSIIEVKTERLNVGDTVDVRGWQGSGAALNSTGCYLRITRLSP